MALEAEVFPKSCCHHGLNDSTEQMVVLSFISLHCIHGRERTILTNRTFVTIYVLRTLHEKLNSENNRFKSVLISLCKKKKKILRLKKDTIEYLKSHSKGSEIYRLSYSTVPNFLRQPTMVTNIFEDFEPPSKNS